MDDHVLRFLYDDNQRVEPEWYMPIIPMVLINGAEGIGTGWSCKIPNFDIREVVNNIRRLMDGEEPLPMVNNALKTNVSLVSSFSTLKRFKQVLQSLKHQHETELSVFLCLAS